jgi:hypothetical protein
MPSAAIRLSKSRLLAGLQCHKRLWWTGEPFDAPVGVSLLDLQVPAYVVARQAIGVKPGTIRRELSALVTMLRLAYEHGKLLRLPTVHKPKDGPAPRRILRGGAVCGRAALLAPRTCAWRR